MKPTALLHAYDRLAAAFFDRLRDPLLLFLRLTWGWMFFQTGKGKLGNIAGTGEFFQSLGIPLPILNAVLVGGLECVGGLLLLLGLLSRPVALLLAGNMLVAYLTADRAGFASLRAFTEATPYPFLMTSLLVLAFGPGRLALDSLRGRQPAQSATTATTAVGERS